MSSYKRWPSFKRNPNAAGGPRKSIYSDLYVKGSRRAKFTPRVERPWRVKKLAWGGLMTFYRNRFYEIDRWYKARIEKPVIYPNLHLIDPENHTLSLVERVEQMELKDSELSEPVDIGLPYTAPLITKQQRQEKFRDRGCLEVAARHRTLDLDPSEIETENNTSSWPLQLARLCWHFGIFQDLFHPDAYFHPVVSLGMKFRSDNNAGDGSLDVYFGNDIPASSTISQPSVSFEAEENRLYTLLMVNPDGNPYEEGKDILHWMVSNIPGGDISKGDVLCEYIQALPFKGTGWHRIVLVLFRQDEGKVEFQGFSKDNADRNLERRSFSTAKFYKKMEDEITPVGLCFFQTQWDVSCRDCIHQKLNMEMPVFELDWPEPLLREQEEFPEKPVPFNLYLDKYRNSKNVEEELLKKRLKQTSPFSKENRKPEKYPDIFWYENKHSLSSWEHSEKRKDNLGIGKYRAIYENRIK